jgi:hypothetical protein
MVILSVQFRTSIQGFSNLTLHFDLMSHYLVQLFCFVKKHILLTYLGLMVSIYIEASLYQTRIGMFVKPRCPHSRAVALPNQRF